MYDDNNNIFLKKMIMNRFLFNYDNMMKYIIIKLLLLLYNKSSTNN